MARFPLAVCALALLLLGGAQACNFFSGGAGAFSDVGPIVTKEGAKEQKINTSLPIAIYQTNSADIGIINFTAGVFCTTVADSPFSITTETKFAAAFPGAKLPQTNKYSLPLVIATFGFFVNPGVGKNTSAVVSLTWNDTFNLFYSGGNWNQPFESAKDKLTPVKGAFDVAKTKVTPLSRVEPAGATEVVKKFWAKAAGSTWKAPPGIFTSTGEFNGDPFPYNATTGKWYTASSKSFQVRGAGTICLSASGIVGAITYSQKTICLSYQPLVEVRLKNAAGNYIKSSDKEATPQSIIPRKYPASDVYWNAINTIWTSGQYTPPTAAFIYLFARKNYTSTVNGKKAKAFVQYAVKNTAGIATKIGYVAIPQNLTSLNIAAAAAIITAK